jgi:hypothetical protein
MQKYWKAKMERVKKGQLILDEAKEDLKADYGSNDSIWTFSECLLLKKAMFCNESTMRNYVLNQLTQNSERD